MQFNGPQSHILFVGNLWGPCSNIALDFYTGPYPYWTAIYFANRAACVYAAGGGWAWWRHGVCPNVLITAASDQSEDGEEVGS